MTSLPVGEKMGFGPMHTVVNAAAFPPADLKAAVRVNFDTLCSVAWLDLTKEPMIVSWAGSGCYAWLGEIMRNLGENRCSDGAVFAATEARRPKNLVPFDKEKTRYERGQPAGGGAGILETAGHDLRGSVSTMLVLGEVLMDAAGARMSESERDVLSGILSSGEEALRITEDFLDLSTGKAGISKLSLEPVDLVSLVCQSVAVYRPISDRKGAQMALHIDQAPPLLMLDWMKIVRALNKLISHAIDNSTAKGTIEVRVSSSTRFARVCVQDQGPEIPPDGLRKRSPPSSWIERDRAPRTRIELDRGLVIAKWIVNAHGGRIRMSSKAGFGEEFLLILPLNLGGPKSAVPIY